MGSDHLEPSDENKQPEVEAEVEAEAQQESAVPELCEVSIRLADNGQLLAELNIDESQIPMPVTLMSLKGMLREEPYTSLWIDEPALKSVVAKAAAGEVGRVVIGERRDAKAEVLIASNKREVHVDLFPAYGGHTLNVGTLKAVLLASRVSDKCIDEALLHKAIELGQGKGQLVAQAIEPIAGEDGYLKVLIQESVSTLSEDERGNVDFHQLQDFVVVEEGAELARIVPHSLGTPGMDVMGIAIAPISGKAFSFSSSLEGAAISRADHNLLLATVKGHPVILKDGVKVDPALVLPNVNLASGNIDFDGSVMIKGSVASGYEVRATGDVVVKDTVDKARIIAGGNISVANGIIGEDRTSKPKKIRMNADDEQEEDDEFEDRVLGAYLSAAGDISARFVNLAELEAGQNVVVREYLMHCRVTAKDSVLLGQGGGRGAIFGGVITAGTAVVANNLGNDAYIKTAVEVGEANQYASKLKEIRLQAQKRQADYDKLSEALEKIQRFEKQKPLTPELIDKAKKITATLQALKAQLNKLAAVKEQINQRRAARKPASVGVKNVLYPNVQLTVDGVNYKQSMESKAVCLKNVDDEIVLSAFERAK